MGCNTLRSFNPGVRRLSPGGQPAICFTNVKSRLSKGRPLPTELIVSGRFVNRDMAGNYNSRIAVPVRSIPHPRLAQRNLPPAASLVFFCRNSLVLPTLCR